MVRPIKIYTEETEEKKGFQLNLSSSVARTYHREVPDLQRVRPRRTHHNRLTENQYMIVLLRLINPIITIYGLHTVPDPWASASQRLIELLQRSLACQVVEGLLHRTFTDGLDAI